MSEREAFAPRRSLDFPSWSVLRGLAKLRVVKDDSLFRAFMFGTLGEHRGMFFEHFSEHAFDASNLQDLISSLGKFEVVASCFWDSAWAHCFSEVIDLINDSMASELVCVPAEFVCYVVSDLLRCFYAVAARRFTRSPADEKEGFPSSLASIPEMVQLFKVIFRRLPLYLTEIKVSHWQRNAGQGFSAATLFNAEVVSTAVSLKRDAPVVRPERKNTKRAKTAVKRTGKKSAAEDDASASSGVDPTESSDEGGDSDNSVLARTRAPRKGSYCAYWLLEKYKISSKKCASISCPFLHEIPRAKDIPRFCSNLTKMASPLPDIEWDALLKELGAPPRKGK